MVCTLTHKRCLPADRYLISVVSYASRTKILRLRLRMTMRAGRKERNAVCRLISDFYRLIPAPILRRLRRHPLPKEGGSGSSACTTGVTNVNPVTLSSYSLPSGNTTPSEPFEPFEPSEPGPLRGPFRHHNPQISFLNSQISSHPLNPLFPCVMMEVSFFRGR